MGVGYHFSCVQSFERCLDPFQKITFAVIQCEAKYVPCYCLKITLPTPCTWKTDRVMNQEYLMNQFFTDPRWQSRKKSI